MLRAMGCGGPTDAFSTGTLLLIGWVPRNVVSNVALLACEGVAGVWWLAACQG